MRGALVVVLLPILSGACGARSNLDVSSEQRTGSGGGSATTSGTTTSGTTTSSTTTTSTTTTSTTSTGTGGATPVAACHPGDAPKIVAKSTGAWGLALDDTDVYFAGRHTDTVGRVAKVGGAVDTLASAGAPPMFVAIDATNVYWTSSCTGPHCGVFTVPKTGGAQVLIDASTNAAQIAVDDTSVYWIEDGPTGVPGSVKSAPKQGGPAQMLATGMGGPFGIALDDAFVYWTAVDVYRVPKGGGPSETLVHIINHPTAAGAAAVAVDDTRVYFPVQADSSFVASAPKTGGAQKVLATGLELPYGITIDAESVYVADKILGSIFKIPKGGGPKETVASGMVSPANLVVDDACVYWSNGETVWRAPK